MAITPAKIIQFNGDIVAMFVCIFSIVNIDAGIKCNDFKILTSWSYNVMAAAHERQKGK
jgi:hypothetical protein